MCVAFKRGNVCTPVDRQVEEKTMGRPHRTKDKATAAKQLAVTHYKAQ